MLPPARGLLAAVLFNSAQSCCVVRHNRLRSVENLLILSLIVP